MQIDMDLYSRQIGTFGVETMGKLIKMKVIVMGLRGLGVEVAKNLILAGPKHVLLFDPAVTEIRDLGANFYTDASHVGKVSRAEACLGKLKELNPYVKVEVLKDEKAFYEAMKDGSVHVVCQTQTKFGDVFYNQGEIDSTCR